MGKIEESRRELLTNEEIMDIERKAKMFVGVLNGRTYKSVGYDSGIRSNQVRSHVVDIFRYIDNGHNLPFAEMEENGWFSIKIARDKKAYWLHKLEILIKAGGGYMTARQALEKTLINLCDKEVKLGMWPSEARSALNKTAKHIKDKRGL